MAIRWNSERPENRGNWRNERGERVSRDGTRKKSDRRPVIKGSGDVPWYESPRGFDFRLGCVSGHRVGQLNRVFFEAAFRIDRSGDLSIDARNVVYKYTAQINSIDPPRDTGSTRTRIQVVGTIDSEEEMSWRE